MQSECELTLLMRKCRLLICDFKNTVGKCKDINMITVTRNMYLMYIRNFNFNMLIQFQEYREINLCC